MHGFGWRWRDEERFLFMFGLLLFKGLVDALHVFDFLESAQIGFVNETILFAFVFEVGEAEGSVGVCFVDELLEEFEVGVVGHHFFYVVVHEVEQTADATVVFGFPAALNQFYFGAIFTRDVEHVVDREGRVEHIEGFYADFGGLIRIVLV